MDKQMDISKLLETEEKKIVTVSLKKSPYEKLMKQLKKRKIRISAMIDFWIDLSLRTIDFDKLIIKEGR